MPRRARSDHINPVDLAALAPYGIARVADLVTAGIQPSTIQRRCRSGKWRRVAPGCIRIGPGASAEDQLLHAALAHAGDGAVLTGVHALHRHDLRRTGLDGRIRVLVPADRRRRSTGISIVERTGRLPEGVRRDGLRIAPVDRAVLDTARTLDRRDAVRSVIAEAVQRKRTTVARLRQELDEGSQRGSALPREVLHDVDCGIRSVGEGWALDLHRRSNLPPLIWNPQLFTAGGRPLASPDGFFDDVAMAWEIDSKEFHLTPEDWEETLRRRALMTNAQIVVAHHPAARADDQRADRGRPPSAGAPAHPPAQVVEDLWGAYRLAASRPCPQIRVVR